MKVLALLGLAPSGLSAIVWGQVVVAFGIASWVLYLQARHLRIGIRGFLLACAPSAWLGFAAGVGAFFASRTLGGGPVWIEFAGTYAAAAGAASIAALVVKHELVYELKRAASVGRQYLAKRG
jgi:hypothetical protein